VIDDVHELGSAEACSQLELLIMRAPPELRFALATRHDLRLGLHRLRLEGELTAIRAVDLRFTETEARELLGAAGVKLAEPTLAMLYERTEGWAAGLRLVALSLAGHPDPERFAAEFSGSERTEGFRRRLEALPGDTRSLLLVAASEPAGDPVLGRPGGRAARDLGFGGEGGPGGRVGGDRCAGAVPASAAAVGGVLLSLGAGAADGVPGAGRGDRSRPRPGSAGVASGRGGAGAR
jgi:LuxR family maltose regulon positive regulatory protein